MAHDTEKLRELLERCEKGRGSDRELDVDIAAMLIDATKRCDWYAYQSMRPKGSPERPARSYWERSAPRLTVSMDAVINLAEQVIDGPAWNVDKRVCGGHVNYTADVDSCDGHGPNAPRALLSAVLSALISQAESFTLRDGLTRAEAHKMEGGSGLSSCPAVEGESA